MRLLSLTKPGIIFGNIITVSGGYILGSQDGFNIGLLLITIIGMALVIACGCVFNNYIDRDIDGLMARTKNRVLVQGLISNRTAILSALLFGLLGAAVLYLQTNLLTLAIALTGLFFYVVVYSLWFKRKSTYGTVVGGIAGAVPPVVGYCAATNSFNAGAIILFMILFLWQMPHFYAIAIYRQSDYAAAAIPVLPIKKGIRYTKISMLVYIAAFTVAAVMPTFFGYTGWLYFIVALCSGLVWFYYGVQGFTTKDNEKWARKMFLFSIINITLLCIMMSVKP